MSNNPNIEGVRTATIADLEQRQKELDARANELDRLERQQNQQRGPASDNNWPPIPPCLPCRPCFRQSFNDDFSDTTRPMIRIAYYAWLFYTFTLFINIVGTLGMFIAKGDPSSGSMFGVSILVVLLIVPLSYLLWYRSLYRALRLDSSVSFFTFFILFAIQFLVVVTQAVGVPILGSCGWFNSITAFTDAKDKQVVVGGIMMCIAVLFTLCAVIDAYILFKVHQYYRSSGATLQKAQMEVGQGLASDPTVRQAAGSAALSAGRNAFK